MFMLWLYKWDTLDTFSSVYFNLSQYICVCTLDQS